MRIATKGVVELFNTVSEFQTSAAKDVIAERKAKEQRYSQAVQQTGSSYLNQSNKTIVAKLQEPSKSRWKVLNPDEDVESDVDSDGNLKIKDLE